MVQISALWIKKFVCKLRRQVRVCGNLKEKNFVGDSMLGRYIEDLLKRQSCDVKESSFFFFIERYIAGKKKNQVQYFFEKTVLIDAGDQCLLNILC